MCRICFDPAWSRDDTGFVHLCCSRVTTGLCPACQTAKILRPSSKQRRTERRELFDEIEPEPRHGYLFACGHCGRHSGLYATKKTCEEELAAHHAQRCPGPWLLDDSAEIPTVWNTKVVKSAWTRAQEVVQQDDQAGW